MTTFTNIGIISKPHDPLISDTVRALYRYLSERSLHISVDDVTAALIDQYSVGASSMEEIAQSCNLVIVVGGDGTLLYAAHSMIEKGIPLLGVNLGRLGFLAEISPKNIEKELDLILAGNFIEERRFVLQTTLIRDGKTHRVANAVNDVVVHAMQMVRMIEIETRVDGQHLDTPACRWLYRVDPDRVDRVRLIGRRPHTASESRRHRTRSNLPAYPEQPAHSG